MITITESLSTLRKLGLRLRAARLERDDTMATFAQRIGVSVPTLRAMETGASTVQIGHWMSALWALDRLRDLDHVLEPVHSLLERARLERVQPRRQRARRRPRSG